VSVCGGGGGGSFITRRKRAGLVVAIPALFGYNYLSVQVKEITTDLRLFVEEFITKMAEFYPEKDFSGSSH
jgi:hypothetical protein